MTLTRICFSTIVLIAAMVFAVPGVFAQDSEVAANTTNRQTSRLISTGKRIITPETNTPRTEPLNLTRVGVQTAQPMPLSLNEAIRKALEANNTIEISRGDVRFQETIVNGNKGIFDPVFTASPTFSQTSNTGSTATHDFQVNAGVSQFIRQGGGSYQAFFNNSRTEGAFSQQQISNGSLSSSGGAAFLSTLGANYTQPLLRNFGFDSRRQILRISQRRLKETDVDFRTQVINTINFVQRTYWDLVAALRNQQNQVASVNLARENLRQIDAKISAGSAAPLERAEVATELANRENDLILATQQVSIVENNLKQQLIRDPVAAEWSQSYVPTDAPAVDLNPVSMDGALKDATDNRFELQRLKIEQEINDINIRLFKNQLKPQVDLNTSFSLRGLSSTGGTTNDLLIPLISGDPTLNANAFLLQQLRVLNPSIVVPNVTIPGTPTFLSGGFNRSFANLFRSDAPNFTIGATISFPFRNRTAKANLAGARVQQDQLAAQTRAQEEVVVVEVRNAVQAVETTRQSVVATRTARENAEIQLDGERKLYDAGRSTTFLLFQRENALTSAQNAEIRALTDYKKAVADLQRATATTFRENNIDVASPVVIK